MHAVPEPLAVEARAKIMWGESPEGVRDYLTSKNVSENDAALLLEEVLTERAASIRSDGMKKIWLGLDRGSGCGVWDLFLAVAGIHMRLFTHESFQNPTTHNPTLCYPPASFRAS